MSDEKPLLYVILGAAGAGRRSVVADLIEGGLEETETPVVFLAQAETAPVDAPTFADIRHWGRTAAGEIDAAWPDEAKVGFFLTDGRADPVDQIEVLKPWIAAQGVELARVICVVHCALLAQHPPLLHWYDACIHFTDIALLNRRDQVENKWLSDYRTRFAKRHLPCLVEMVKKGRVPNPALVLDLQTRRLSHWFDADEDQDWKSFIDDPDTLIIDDSEDDDTDAVEGNEEDEYLARYPGGVRKKVLPDIRDYLENKKG